MPRKIAPGNPPAIDAKLVNVKMPDFKVLDDLGDARIKAANQNFKLYADTLIKSESAKLYEQYKNNPIQLSNALGKLPEMLKGLPEELQDEMNGKLYLTGIGLVQKAQNNMLVEQDIENAQNANKSIELSKALMAQEYQNILQNHISKAEDKNLVSNDVFLAQQMNLNDLADITNHLGKNMYSETQRKAIRNVDDLELAGFKQFFDTMLLNDNDKLEQSKDYYTKFILAPDRFMAENYMNRETYDKARTYAEKELRRAGADIKNAKFNQSIKEATELQITDLPGRLESLRSSGQLDSRLIDSIEKVNVKFNEIDPSKSETPVALLNALQIITNRQYEPAPTTQEEQQKILEQGVVALDAVADYAQKYGMSPQNVARVRETIVNLETNTAFQPILENFRDIIDNFDVGLKNVRNRSTKGNLSAIFGNLFNINGIDDSTQVGKIIALNNLLATSTDNINQLIRNGDWDGVRREQKNTQKRAAQIKYDWIDWDLWSQKPDQEFTSPTGRVVKVKDFTFDGDIMFETLD